MIDLRASQTSQLALCISEDKACFVESQPSKNCVFFSCCVFIHKKLCEACSSKALKPCIKFSISFQICMSKIYALSAASPLDYICFNIRVIIGQIINL